MRNYLIRNYEFGIIAAPTSAVKTAKRTKSFVILLVFRRKIRTIVRTEFTFIKGGRGQGDSVPCRAPQSAKFPKTRQKRRVGWEMRQHFEGRRTRPPPLVASFKFLSFKTFRWNVLNDDTFGWALSICTIADTFFDRLKCDTWKLSCIAFLLFEKVS